MLFNVAVMLVMFVIPLLRPLPLAAVGAVANVATRHKWFAFVYIVSFFIVLPVLVILSFGVL